MRSVAVCGKKVKELLAQNDSICEVEIEGVPVTFGLISTNPPHFDPSDPRHRHSLLIKVRAFSCNYRDRAMIFMALDRGLENSFYPVGSEFVADVVAVGAEVGGFQAGDRVIGDNSYLGPTVNENGTIGGIPTNNASKEYQVFHQDKLIKIPAEMTDADAAAFGIGAQTIYSMIRKLGIESGTNVLVTAAKSNTSLFAISALRKHKVSVYATSTSRRFEDELKALGVKEIIELKRENGALIPAGDNFSAFLKETGRFHYVIDPFFDLHLPLATALMEPGGKYATCGMARQFERPAEDQPQAQLPNLRAVLTNSLINNYQLITNCLGSKQDLQAAIEDYRAGDLRIVVDSIHRDNQVGSFFERTFKSAERFGKVVYAYD